MSSLIAFPNRFQTDDSTQSSKFLYSFSASVDVSDVSFSETVLTGSLYKQIQVPTEISNVKFNFSEYSFNGIYLTNQKDEIDTMMAGTHMLMIECKNHKLDKFLFIAIPIADSNNDTNLNTLFNVETKVITDLNYFIPAEEKFYSYVTTGINTKESTVILYTKSNLSVKKIDNLLALVTPAVQSIPLTLSADPGLQVSMITATYNESDIYIDCQPVEETNADKSIFTIKDIKDLKIVSTNAKYYKFVKTYFTLFLIGLSIFILISSVLYWSKSSP